MAGDIVHSTLTKGLTYASDRQNGLRCGPPLGSCPWPATARNLFLGSDYRFAYVFIPYECVKFALVHSIQECDLHVGASIGLPAVFLSTTLSYAGLPFIGLPRSDNF